MKEHPMWGVAYADPAPGVPVEAHPRYGTPMAQNAVFRASRSLPLRREEREVQFEEPISRAIDSRFFKNALSKYGFLVLGNLRYLSISFLVYTMLSIFHPLNMFIRLILHILNSNKVGIYGNYVLDLLYYSVYLPSADLKSRTVHGKASCVGLSILC
jgi:hypothetical protein